MDINKLLASDDFDENLKILREEINRLKPLIETEGGIKKIQQMQAAARSKAEIATIALENAKNEAENLLQEAKTKAKEIESTAKEKAEQQLVLLSNQAKVQAERETELKKEKSAIEQAKRKLLAEQKGIEKEKLDLTKREAKVSEYEKVISQLPKAS